MHSRSKQKYSQRRQINKQLIKRQLLQEVNPLRRQHRIASRSKAKTEIQSKFASTLQFLERNETEAVLVQRFQQKVEKELQLGANTIAIVFADLFVDKRIVALSTKLINSKKGSEQNIKLELKRLVSTASTEIKQTIDLLLFFHFIHHNRNEYRTLLRQFESSRVLEVISALKHQGIQLISSKVLSVISMVCIKYQEMAKYLKLAQQTMQVRRNIERTYYNVESMSIDSDYASTTLFFSFKYLQYQLNSGGDSYELMLKIQKEIEQFKYSIKGMVDQSVKEIFMSEVHKLKAIVSSKIEQDYYQSTLPLPQQSAESKTKQAIKLYKRRRSLTNLKKRSLIEAQAHLADQQQNRLEMAENYEQSRSISRERSQKNVRSIYVPARNNNTNVSIFEKNVPESKLKKTAKNNKQPFASAPPSANKQEIPKDKSKSSYGMEATILMNYGSVFLKQQASHTQEKKHKIEQIYGIFVKENNIIRDIPSKDLEREMEEVYRVRLGNKSNVKEMFRHEIINFTAGLSNNTLQFDKILNLKSCLSLEFIKLWIGQLYRCKVELEVSGTKCTVKATLNGETHILKLHRGQNVICERYLTIWPTVRYLISKKMATLNVFNAYEKELIAKKKGESQVIELCSLYYESSIGVISKQQIEEINICLDNLVKLTLVLIHYYDKRPLKVELNKEYKHRIAASQQKSGQLLKLNLITEIYLNELSKVHLFTFLLSSKFGCFIIKAYSPRQQLLSSINQRSALQVQLKITDANKLRQQDADKFLLHWEELQVQRVCYDDFVKFIKAKCAKIKINRYFLDKLIDFITRRLHIEFNPIFKTQIKFKATANPDYLQKYTVRRGKQTASHCFAYNSQSMLKVFQNDDYVDSCFMQKKEQFIPVILPKCSPNRWSLKRRYKVEKRKEGVENGEKIWQQQVVINGRRFLTRIIVQAKCQNDYEADYILIDRKTARSNILKINNLDLQQLAQQSHKQQEQPHIQADNRISQGLQEHEDQPNSQSQKRQLIGLLSSLDFYHNHHLRKIFVNSQFGSYCHSFKDRNRKSYKQAKMRNNTTQTILRQPFLIKSQLYCKLRITKVIKISRKYAFLTLKRISFQQQFFWEAILEFQRRHTQLVCLLEEKKVLEMLSDFKRVNRNPFKTITQSRFCQESLQQSKISARESFLLPLQTSRLNLHLNFKQEQSGDYKKRILKAFQTRQIEAEAHQNNQYTLNIRNEQYAFRERIIEEYDHHTARIYFVWFDGEWLEVQLLLDCELNSSNSSQKAESPFLKGYYSEILGKLQFFNAKRFYEMQNKDLEEGDDYCRRVCAFYLEWCKHQRIKYENKMQRSSH